MSLSQLREAIAATGNVRVTPDGKVKVLDFGLAKAWSGESRAASSSSTAECASQNGAGDASARASTSLARETLTALE